MSMKSFHKATPDIGREMIVRFKDGANGDCKYGIVKMTKEGRAGLLEPVYALKSEWRISDVTGWMYLSDLDIF